MPRLLSDAELDRQLPMLPRWQRNGTALTRTEVLPSFAAVIEVVNEVAAAAEQMNHHPDIDIRWRSVTFALTTHSAGGLTQWDVELAHRIDESLAELSQ